jgi:hypothetical protein
MIAFMLKKLIRMPTIYLPMIQGASFVWRLVSVWKNRVLSKKNKFLSCLSIIQSIKNENVFNNRKKNKLNLLGLEYDRKKRNKIYTIMIQKSN